MNRSDSRVSSYLDDLARMLTDLDPADRDEVLAGVREHLDATLAEHPDDPAVVEAALLRLGPPEQVAAQARADLAPTQRTAPWAPPTTERPLPHRGWLVAAIALLIVTTLPFTVGTALERVVGSGMDGSSSSMFGLPAIFPGVVLMFLAWPLWVGAVVCTVIARGRAPRTWGALLALGPICFATAAIGTFWREPQILSQVVSVVLLLAATGLTLAAVRVAWGEVRA